jgi:hypothetical protein
MNADKSIFQEINNKSAFLPVLDAITSVYANQRPKLKLSGNQKIFMEKKWDRHL